MVPTRDEARRMVVSLVASLALGALVPVTPYVAVPGLVAMGVFWLTVLRVAARETGYPARVLAGFQRPGKDPGARNAGIRLRSRSWTRGGTAAS